MKPTVSTDGGSIKWSCAVSYFNQTKNLVRRGEQEFRDLEEFQPQCFNSGRRHSGRMLSL